MVHLHARKKAMDLQGHLLSPPVCHGLVAKAMAAWSAPGDMQLFHYIDDVILSSDSLAELEQAAGGFQQCLVACSWAISETRVLEPVLFVKF